jgi:hypothetical protein
MTIKYTSIFHYKALQNLPKLGFLVWKQTIWQPCLAPTEILAPTQWWSTAQLVPRSCRGANSRLRELKNCPLLRSCVDVQHAESHNVEIQIVIIYINGDFTNYLSLLIRTQLMLAVTYKTSEGSNCGRLSGGVKRIWTFQYFLHSTYHQAPPGYMLLVLIIRDSWTK